MLRKHQTDMINIIDGIIKGSPVRNIFVTAVPGAGKSSLPIIAGKLIEAGLADAICWVCPRMSLQEQAERNFVDPFFRNLLGHKLTIRSATNETNPCRGTNGFVTTYQALGVDQRQTVLNDFRRKRYILILDECHHASAEEGAAWTEALKPLYDLASYRILMSGTALRGDGHEIAFWDNQPDGEAIAAINYSRRDALLEKAILPMEFHLYDGQAKWESARGVAQEANISTVDPQKRCYALYTALHTDYAREMLTAAVSHWREWKKQKGGHGKMLVVAANIAKAKEYTAFLKEAGEHAKIATSDDTPGAANVLNDLKTGNLGICVSVAMAYEGLDAPSVSHIACLTNIRSVPWISQMVARAVRIDPNAGPYESQTAHVFAPADGLFVEAKRQIESDQQWADNIRKADAKKELRKGRGKGANGDEFCLTPPTPGGIRPIGSSLQMDGRKARIAPTGTIPETPALIPSEIEAGLLKQIESHIRAYSFQNRYNPKKINAEVFARFEKPRRAMTIDELRGCLRYIQMTYPMTSIRGTGIRAPTKATQIAVAWRG